jgi:hypothetical protein
MTLTWFGDDGQVFNLSGTTGVVLVEEPFGLYEIPTDLVIDPRVSVDGGALITQRRGPRALTLPLMVDGDARALHAQALKSFGSGGELRYDAADGQRWLRKVVLESVDANVSGQDYAYRGTDVFTVSLIALDPWWYGEPELIEVDLDDEGTAWDAPIDWDANVPWDGGWAVEIDIAGDAPASPVWGLTGPLTTLTVVSGEQAWRWTSARTISQAGQIDTRPGNRGPRLGTDLTSGFAAPGWIDWTLLDQASRLFTLPAGASDLIVGPTGQGAGARLFGAYEPRYLTP